MAKPDRADAITDIRQQIDSLATALILEEGNAGPGKFSKQIRSTLAEVCEKASAVGSDALTKAASRVRSDLENASDSWDRDSFQLAIAALQDAVEEEQSGSALAGTPDPPRGAGENPVLPPNFDLELFSDFLLESREHLSNIETQLLAVEQDPGNRDALHTTFRGFHTIKGLAGFLEFGAIQAVAHEVETILDLARNDQLTITPGVIDVVLAAADYLKTELQSSESSVRSGQPIHAADNDALLSRIKALTRQVPAPATGELPPSVPEAAKLTAAAGPSAADREPIRPAEGRKSNGLLSSRPALAPSPSEGGGAKPSGAESHAVKVDTAKLDFLVDMVGEMVIAQSMLRHDSSLMNPRVQRNLVQLSRITGEVQKTAMSMRMVPIGQLFHRMARLVRDLTRKGGKLAELVTQGEDTELDRTIVEELADPLMHMVRNSADHGIEGVEDRLKAGKDRMGRITLKAYHQAGYITIEVGDDGRGLDREKILAKARRNGLISDGQDLSETEIFNLIFEPGFSTAEQVTDISGRGVGMDVVRKHVQKMRGRIDIRSQKGHGTTFFIKLPLTLAIIEGLVVGVGKERYVVPIFSVKEMIRATPENVKTVHGRSEMVLVRGNLLPIVRLHNRFGVSPKSADICDGLLIVAESSTKAFCVLVDEFIGKQEVVIKSLGERFKDVSGLAGAAILGDGRVGLIVDVDGLIG